MESHSATVTLPPAEVAELSLSQRTTSPQSSISSVRFAIPSDCASYISSLEENTSCWGAKSHITSKHDTYSSLYQNLASDMASRYFEDSERAVCGSISELPPVREGDTLSVHTRGTSLTSRSTPSVRCRGPRLDISIRRSKSESEELAVAHVQAVAMYKDRSLVETQKIFCEICQAAGCKFVLKNLQELTLHLHIHNMPEHTHCSPVKDGVRRAFVKTCCCEDGSTLDN